MNEKDREVGQNIGPEEISESELEEIVEEVSNLDENMERVEVSLEELEKAIKEVFDEAIDEFTRKLDAMEVKTRMLQRDLIALHIYSLFGPYPYMEPTVLLPGVDTGNLDELELG